MLLPDYILNMKIIIPLVPFQKNTCIILGLLCFVSVCYVGLLVQNMAESRVGNCKLVSSLGKGEGLCVGWKCNELGEGQLLPFGHVLGACLAF